jgi:exopolysaccharide production protein ExoQ
MEQVISKARPTAITLFTSAFVLPPLAVFAPLGVAPLLSVAAVVLLALDWRRCLSGVMALRPLALLVAALGVWTVASALWSIIPGHSLLEGLRFLIISGTGLAVMGAITTAEPAERRQVGHAIAFGGALAFGLLVLERFGDAPITRFWLHPAPEQYLLARFDRGVTVLVLATWPAALAEPARLRRVLILAAAPAIAFFMVSQTALLAALLGIAVYLLAYLAPRIVAGVMIIGLLGVALTIPLAAPANDRVIALWHEAPWIKSSGIHRLLIWRFGADRVAERPLLGWGMDSSRAMPGGKTDLNALLPDLHYGDRIEAMPLHPHDAALQLQLELGLPGSIVGLGIVIWIIRQMGWRASLAPDRRAGALALIAAALTVGLLSFGLWQAWWLSTLWLVAALYAATGTEEPCG